jgi:hypothetical protein
MDERRAVARQRTFLKGVLAFNNGNSSEDCMVRNLTDTGALIELPHPNAPAAFDLIVSARGLHRRARVVWRNGGKFGLELDPAAPPRRAVIVH